jgi:hypothetical protein
MLMKKTCVAAGLVLLAFWLGVNFGYHGGVRAERLLWEATGRVEPMGVVAVGEKPARIVYRNPRSGPVLTVSIGKPMVNVPDPRTYLQYPGLRP